MINLTDKIADLGLGGGWDQITRQTDKSIWIQIKRRVKDPVKVVYWNIWRDVEGYILNRIMEVL